MHVRIVFTLLLATACTGEGFDPPGLVSGVPILGHLNHSPESVAIDVVLDRSDGLRVPRDLAFNPERTGELWVVNRKDDSTVIAFDAGTPGMAVEKRIDPYALHFMEEVSSIAFGAPGTFATCQESRNTYNDQGPPNDFMGPTLWSTDLDTFAASNPAAVEFLTDLFGMPTDLGSHLDMLHNTPLCMGIAWQADNEYWVFDGANGAIQWVDFASDHGPGFDDHSDGRIRRYAEGEFQRKAGVPSHMVLDPTTALLYVADSGNGRVAVMDTASGRKSDDLSIESMEPYPEHVSMRGADVQTLVDDPELVVEPSGLALHRGVLYVADHATGIVSAWLATDGTYLDHLDTGLGEGALMGIALGPNGALWLVNARDNEVVRVREH